MPWDMFWDYAWKIGFPFVLVCMALGGFYTRKIVTKADYDEMLQFKDAIINEKNATIKETMELAKTNGRIAEAALRKAERDAGKRAR